jgi:hypothetical protein
VKLALVIDVFPTVTPSQPTAFTVGEPTTV